MHIFLRFTALLDECLGTSFHQALLIIVWRETIRADNIAIYGWKYKLLF